MCSQGIHARSGVACADCHMPYEREGAMKISDHHVRSPLLNIDRACQTCHKWPEEEMRERASTTIQDRTFETAQHRDRRAGRPHRRHRAAARRRTAPTRSLTTGARFQRAAQFYADFVEAENSMGFHADQEAARILGNSINFSRLGQAALRGEPVPDAPLAAAAASAHRSR